MPTPNPYDPLANPNLRAAVVAYWLVTPGLTAISAAPYADEAASQVTPPYCVLRVPTGRVLLQDTGRKKQVQFTYLFEVYDYDQDVASALGEQMKALLDPLHNTRPRFAGGYLMHWDWQSEGLMEVPEVGRANTIWRQTHAYVADVIRTGGV